MYICKIYIPHEYYASHEDTSLYGFCEETKEFTTFYIVDKQNTGQPGNSEASIIGSVSTNSDKKSPKSGERSHHKPFCEFTSSTACQNIQIRSVELAGIPEESLQVQLILYHAKNFIYLSKNESIEADSRNEIVRLAYYLRIHKNHGSKVSENKCFSLVLKLLALFGMIFKPIFHKSAVAYHAEEWYDNLKKKGLKKGHTWTIAFDVAAGLSILIWLHYIGNPAEYLLEFAYTIVYYLRGLLTSLRGSPAGLKLNVQLNHFLLKCFIYHVDLWATFLEIVSPAIHYLFLPLSILGLCGLSFQLALLSDLLVLITLHAHCFYIYAAVLYRLEIVGIGALWRVVLGRRKNVLKNRVEAFEYKNSQLYLATLFFASLLFLLPTVLVYYVVFATLRFGTYCITYLLLIIRRRILHLPVDTIMRWLLGVYISPDNVEVKIMNADRGNVDGFGGSVTMLLIKPLPSWPTSAMIDSQSGDNAYTIGQFFMRLIKGQLMGSIQPKFSV
ncbi:uncharacterized protein LOC132261425 [Phlebotomus argentipes]|uniref:uncharacterized protein LOC132261425 n=1 Tax=Phlebotomus argentipes TaxID=94469 RepID=UPI00289318D9|nr:uncharacterized protein LOC132261425 [Phlebotomus argentipes]